MLASISQLLTQKTRKLSNMFFPLSDNFTTSALTKKKFFGTIVHKRLIFKWLNHLVSFATLIARVWGWGTMRPRWALILVFVGPQWGQTCVPPYMTLNLLWPRLQLRASSNADIRLHVTGAFLQLATDFTPVTVLENKAVY